MTDVEPLYTLESAAARLGVTRETVREWIETRGLRALPLGSAKKYRPRDYIIKETWILTWLEANSRVAVQPATEPAKSEPSRKTRAKKSPVSSLADWKCPV